MKSESRILNIALVTPLALFIVASIMDDFSISVLLICSAASLIVVLRWKFLKQLARNLGNKKLLLGSGSAYFLFFLLTAAVLALAIAKLPAAMPSVLAIVLTQPIVLFLYSIATGIRMLRGGKEPSA